MELLTFAIIALLIFGIFICGLIFLVVKFAAGNKNKNISSKASPPKQKEINKTGINCIRFDASQSGLFTANRERSMLDATEVKATDWINSNPDVKIVNITSTVGKMNASTTVWFKFKISN